MSGYADTSFLVSLYTPDAHSVLAAQLMSRTKQEFFLTPFGELEMINAIQLRLFRKELNSSEIKAASALFQEDIANGIFSRKPMNVTAYEQAKRLARRRTSNLGTRTLDILHVASALTLKAEYFATFDRTQKKLASAEGLKLI